MGEVIHIGALMPNEFAKQVTASENPKKFNLIFRGYDDFDLEKHLYRYKLEFEDVFHDLMACIRCTGACGTRCTQGGTPYYFDLHQRDMELVNDGKPKFRVFACPGVNERKEQIKKLYLDEPETDEREPSKIKARDFQRKILS